MDRVKQRGLTLIEALVALAILGVAAVAIMPAFLTQVDANRRSEPRAGAVTAAQQVVEQLRLGDPSSLPSSGTSAPESVLVGGLSYDVRTQFCVRPEFCDARSRHVIVEVWLDGRRLYDVETVYTQLL